MRQAPSAVLRTVILRKLASRTLEGLWSACAIATEETQPADKTCSSTQDTHVDMPERKTL